MPVAGPELISLLISMSGPVGAALTASWVVRRKVRSRTRVGAWVLWVIVTSLWVSFLLPSLNSTSESAAAFRAALAWGLSLGPAFGLAVLLWASLAKRSASRVRRGFEVLPK